jgi:hypothetical protein
MSSRDEAQRRVDQVRAFRAEIAVLKAGGVSPLSPDQESAIAAYHDRLLQQLAAQYDVDQSAGAGQLSRGMRLVSFFGAVTLTAAIYSVVERFWGRLDLPLQATLLAAFPLMALVGVELSARRERTLYVASLFALVAYGTFWLAVGVLSSTLNIPVTPPFIFAGVLFGLPLAILYRFWIVLAIALAALAVAVSATAFHVAGTEWTYAFVRLEVLAVAGFSLLVLAIPLSALDAGFVMVTRVVAFTIGLGCLLTLSSSGEMSLLPLDTRIVEGVYQAVMFAACVVTLTIAVRRGWNETINLAAVMLALFLLVRFVDWFWDLLPRYLFFLILAAIAFGWLMVLRRMRHRLTRVAV